MNEHSAREKCPNFKANVASCTCTYTPCQRKGLCCQCVAYHRAAGQIPGCFFSESTEKTYDRSITHFVRTSLKGE